MNMRALKMNLVGGMNSYIMAIADDEIAEEWFDGGLKEEQDLAEIVDSDDLWAATCKLFGELVKRAESKGLSL